MKNIYPIILIVLCVLAGASLIYNSSADEKKYNQLIAQADEAVSHEYYVQAVDLLNQARHIKSSYELLCRIGDGYRKLNDTQNYRRVLETAIKEYPESEEAEIKLLQFYEEQGDYAFLVPELMRATQSFPDSGSIREIFHRASGIYDERDAGYLDVEFFENSDVAVERRLLFQNLAEDEESAGPVSEHVLLDPEGNDIFEAPFLAVAPAEDGNSLFKQDEDGVWKKVDYYDNLLADNKNHKFEKVFSLPSDGLGTAVIDGKYHLITADMKVSDISWDYAGVFSEGICAFKNGNKWAFGTAENYASLEYIYDEIGVNRYGKCCCNGVIAVKQNDKWQLVDVKGEAISEQTFSEIKGFESDQPTPFMQNGKYGYINRRGEVYLEPQFEDAMPFANGYAPVKMNGKWGYINRYGEIAMEPVYDEVTPMTANGRAYVKTEEGLWNFVLFKMPFYQ